MSAAQEIPRFSNGANQRLWTGASEELTVVQGMNWASLRSAPAEAQTGSSGSQSASMTGGQRPNRRL